MFLNSLHQNQKIKKMMSLSSDLLKELLLLAKSVEKRVPLLRYELDFSSDHQLILTQLVVWLEENKAQLTDVENQRLRGIREQYVF